MSWKNWKPMLAYPEESRSVDVLSLKDVFKKWKNWKKNEKDVTFPIELCNQNRNTSEGFNRTTNAVEGQLCGVSTLFHWSHPSITTFLEKNWLDASKQMFDRLKATTSNVTRGRKICRLPDENFAKNLADHNASNPINFLVSISHLISS